MFSILEFNFDNQLMYIFKFTPKLLVFLWNSSPPNLSLISVDLLLMLV